VADATAGDRAMQHRHLGKNYMTVTLPRQTLNNQFTNNLRRFFTMLTERKFSLLPAILLLFLSALIFSGCSGSTASNGNLTGGLITPTDGKLEIPVAGISDGKAHHFQVKADDGNIVTFFVLKSADGVLRAAIDACDVCYRS
jgi:uncharacterized membrane protein